MDKAQPKDRAVLPIVSIVTFGGFLDTHLLIPVIALYATALGASTWLTGLIVGLYSITNTPANIFFGRLIDRVGYKLPLLVGLVGDALSMFLYSLCRLPVHLALVRVLHGMSGGLVGPATMSVAADAATATRKGRAMGIYGMSLALATLVGYGLSGVLVSRFGYQAVFLLGMAVLLLGAVMTLLLPGRLQKAAPVAGKPSAVGPSRMRDLVRREGLIVAYLGILAQYFSFGGVVTLLPLYVKGLGMEAFHVGMLLAIFAAMFIAVQMPSGHLSDRIGRLIPTAIGLSLGIVSLIMLPLLDTFPLLAVAMALYGVAYGMIFPSISALVADATTSEERGTATGLFHALLTAGVAIGAPVIGWAGDRLGVTTGLALTASAMGLALLVTLAALRRRPGP